MFFVEVTDRTSNVTDSNLKAVDRTAVFEDSNLKVMDRVQLHQINKKAPREVVRHIKS